VQTMSTRCARPRSFRFPHQQFGNDRLAGVVVGGK